MTTRNDTLQSLCRDYLVKLRPLAVKFGLGNFVDNIISENARHECVATETEVELLGRAVDDERISRTDVPKILGKSYRQAFEDNDFDKVKKLRHTGIYSKISAILLGEELKVLNGQIPTGKC